MKIFKAVWLFCTLLLAHRSSGFAPGPILKKSSVEICRIKANSKRGVEGIAQLRLTAASDSDGEFRSAGPTTEAPVYSDSSLFDRLAIHTFRQGMVRNLGGDVPEEGFKGLMKLALQLNKRFSPKETQRRTRSILVSLFPPFIIKLFPLMFSGPFPVFSAKLNAFITSVTCKWLMGPQELYDLDPQVLEEGWGDGKDQGILIQRCRYLEESGCASVCINSCKVPTQEFFAQDMGIPLWMEPNYDTFECRFKFGAKPPPQQDDEVFSSPCFTQCPSKSRRRHPVKEEELCPTLSPDETYQVRIPNREEFTQRLFASSDADGPSS